MMNSRGLKICDEKNKLSKTDDEFNSCGPYLPEELVLENIVIRLSARDLSRWSCAGKYWYKSILHDSRFAFSHFDHNKNKLNLVFNLLNVWINDRSIGYFLNIDEEEEDNGFLLNYRLLTGISSMASHELAGYCNGLVCTKLLGNSTADRGQITIVNPTRGETLNFDYLTPTSSTHLCQGFCFDSLSQQYKVVIIYTTTSTIAGDDQEFVCMVLTLSGQGTNTNSWRKSVTSTAQVALSTSHPFPGGRMVTRPSKVTRRSATICGGDLLWRITNRMSDDNDDIEIDMLLSFDIHSEEIRFISLPTECSLTGTTATTTNDEFQCLVIDHHLLEFKGYLCVARSEKIMTRSKGHHHHYHHRRHRRHHCNGARRSRFCCCGFKVHLFVLKDKVNQVWIKEETFDLQIKEEQGLLPAPFCCYFDSVCTVTTTITPPTRMLSFRDRLFLYWADGEYLLLYNLQMKHLNAVKLTGRKMQRIDWDIFETKMKKGIRPGRILGNDENPNFPYMDYQLHAQPENILSLKSFIPQGESTRKFHSYRDFEQSTENMENKEPAGLLGTPRELVRFHAFY